MQRTLDIEVVSDPVCPWCYIGKRRLEKAIAQRPGIGFNVHWTPYLLSPDMPREGRNRHEYYLEKFGPEIARRILSGRGDVGKTALQEGIVIGSDPEAMSPNTLSAHVLMYWAGGSDINVDALVEKLMHAHHVTCEDIGDQAVLTRIAGEVGMDEADVAARLAAGDDEARVLAQAKNSAARGISGVPCFVIDGKYGLSGAQPSEVLVQAFDQIVANTA